MAAVPDRQDACVTMSATLEIKSDSIDATLRDLDKLGGAISGDDVKAVMGRAIRGVVVSHFIQIASDSAHHKTARSLGAAPTGIYEKAAQGTSQPEVSQEGVSITIHQVAIAQRFFGGTIEPVNAKFLAIPARSEAYGKRPREFDNLRLILFKSGSGALVSKEPPSGTRRTRIAGSAREPGLIFFWLVKQAVQEADPTVLPTEEEMLNAAVESAQEYIESVWSKN
jgi:hypothetical protein